MDSSQLRRLDKQYLWHPFRHIKQWLEDEPLVITAAEGMYLIDSDGNRYLDFAGGIGCLNAGHRSPRVLAAIREQLDKFLHLCFAVTPYEGYVAVA